MINGEYMRNVVWNDFRGRSTIYETVINEVFRKNYEEIANRGKMILFLLDNEAAVRYVSRVNETVFETEGLYGERITSFMDELSGQRFSVSLDRVRIKFNETIVLEDVVLLSKEKNRHYFDGFITYSEVLPEAPYVVYLHEVTGRRLKEVRLKQSNAELDSFVYKVSHDLKAPLQSLKGLINLAARSVDDQTNEYIGLMRKSVGHLEMYIDKLALYSRNSTQELKYENVNVVALVEDIIEAHRFQPEASRLTFRISASGMEEIVTDVFRLQLVLSNLIANAIKYHDPAQENPFVEIFFRNEIRQMEIQVTDNGLGIDEVYLDKIFNLYQRATSTGNGSGIGLHMVKEAVDKLNGKIKLSKFRISIIVIT